MTSDVRREVALYRQAITLDVFFPRGLRKVLKAILFISTIATLAASLLYVAEARLATGEFSTSPLFEGSGGFFFGLFLISFSALFILGMLSFYYNARYYRGIESISHEGYKGKEKGLTYEVAEVLGRENADLTTALYTSRYGLEMLRRCNIEEEKIVKFLNNKKEPFSSDFIEVPAKGFITLEYIAAYIYENDKEFSEFLFNEGITEETFNGAVLWVMQTSHHVKHDTRWWSRDNLGKIPTVGKEFSYGGAFMLDRFARDIKTTASLFFTIK